MPNTIADNLLRLQAARTDIANAITTMGGTVAAGDGFEDFPAEILEIPAGGPEEIIGIATASPWQLTATGSVTQFDRYLMVDLAFKNTASSGCTIQSNNALCQITNLQLNGLRFSRKWYGSSNQTFSASISQSNNTTVLLTVDSSKSWYSGDTYYLKMLYEYVHT